MIEGGAQHAVGWADAATAYAATFAPLCAGTIDPLLDAAGVGPGQRVLDVGAGTGELAARALARGARVTAVGPRRRNARPLRSRAARREMPRS